MNLGKYIRQLLAENEIVIIPGFGAFISAYKPAEIKEDSQEITPPSKEISFNEKIKNNDGLLVGFIAKSEQIPVHEALGKVEQERDEILYQLDKGEKVVLEGTGALFYNENREIGFEPASEINLLLDAFGLYNESFKDEPEMIPEEKTKEPPVTRVAAENESVTEPEKKTEPASKWAEPYTKERPHRKKRSWLWFLLLLIPLIAAGIYIFFREKTEPPTPVEIITEPPVKEEPLVPAKDSLDSMLTDSISIPVNDSVKIDEITIDSTNYIEPEPSKFYVIGGSFENAENAEKYLLRMKKEGYAPFHLGKHGSFYLVGLEIHDNEIEAYGAQYNFLDKYPDSGVWVFIPE